MNKRTLERFRKLKGVSKVERKPMFLLERKGRKHAGKNLKLVETYINKVLSRCKALENKEVSLANNLLQKSYEEAGVLKITTYLEKDLPGEASNEATENSATDIREKRRKEIQQNSKKASQKENLTKLVKIYEFVTEIDGCLHRRISKMQNLCSEKIYAYILGVKQIKPDFSYDIVYDDSALETYKEDHKKTYSAIENEVIKIYGGENNEAV